MEIIDEAELLKRKQDIHQNYAYTDTKKSRLIFKPFAYSTENGSIILVTLNDLNNLEKQPGKLFCPYCDGEVYIAAIKSSLKRKRPHFRHKFKSREDVVAENCPFSTIHLDIERSKLKNISLEQFYKNRADNFRENQMSVHMKAEDTVGQTKLVSSDLDKAKLPSNEVQCQITRTASCLDEYLAMIQTEEKNKQNRIVILDTEENAIKVIEELETRWNLKSVIIPIKYDNELFAIIDKFGVLQRFDSSVEMLKYYDKFCKKNLNGTYSLSLLCIGLMNSDGSITISRDGSSKTKILKKEYIKNLIRLYEKIIENKLYLSQITFSLFNEIVSYTNLLYGYNFTLITAKRSFGFNIIEYDIENNNRYFVDLEEITSERDHLRIFNAREPARNLNSAFIKTIRRDMAINKTLENELKEMKRVI